MARKAARAPNEAEASVLTWLRSELSREFSDDNADDVALLKRLWEVAHRGGTPTFERVGKRWTAFGFQRDDPVSDLRGGGVLALRNLLTFLESQPEYAVPIMTSRQPRDGEFDPEAAGFYPFAAAGINVTRVVAEYAGLVGDGQQHGYWPFLATDRSCFDQCYALCFRLVDKFFDERQASYMQFNSVLKHAGGELKGALDHCGSRLNVKPDGSVQLRSSRSIYVPQRIAPRPPCIHDSIARVLHLSPPGWGRDPASVSGVLEKLPLGGVLSSRKIAKWKRRYFVLRGDLVAWFKPVPGAEDTAAPSAWRKAEVHGRLANYVRVAPHTCVRANLNDSCAFKIDKCLGHDGKLKSKLRLRASTPAEAQRWMVAIDAAVAAFRNNSQQLDNLQAAATNGLDVDDDDEDDDDDKAERPLDAAYARSSSRDASSTPNAPYPPPPGRPSSVASSNNSSAGIAMPHRRSPSRRISLTSAVARSIRAAGNKNSAASTNNANITSAAQRRPPPPPRSNSWISCTDDTNSQYYVHRPTGLTQWDLPPGWTSPSSGWAARIDKGSGHTYYFFPSTGEVAWTLPDT